MTEAAAPTSPALFYDAECPLCTRSARFIRRVDRRGTLRFASLQSPEGRALVIRDPALATVDSLIWLDASNGHGVPRTRTHSDAVLAVADYLGGIWGALGPVGRLVPVRMRDAAYRWIARHRPHDECCEI